MYSLFLCIPFVILNEVKRSEESVNIYVYVFRSFASLRMTNGAQDYTLYNP